MHILQATFKFCQNSFFFTIILNIKSLRPFCFVQFTDPMKSCFSSFFTFHINLNYKKQQISTGPWSFRIFHIHVTDKKTTKYCFFHTILHKLFVSILYPSNCSQVLTTSICRYFFRKFDTGSLNSIGSIRIFERIKGMYPNMFAKVSMHIWRWEKWNESSHCEFLELFDNNDSRYCFRWVTLIGGSLVTWLTKKFIKMSSQFCDSSTVLVRTELRPLVYK